MFFCRLCHRPISHPGSLPNICKQKYGRPWTSLVYSAIEGEKKLFYDPVSMIGPQPERGHWQFLCTAKVAAPIPMCLIFMRDSQANRFHSDSCFSFCLQRSNRNVGLYLTRSNANLSKEFTLSRVLFCFHPEGDPPSFGQIVHTHVTWHAWIRALRGRCSHAWSVKLRSEFYLNWMTGFLICFYVRYCIIIVNALLMFN